MKPYAKTSTKVNGMHFYCCFTVHSHVNMFNNEHSYDRVIFGLASTYSIGAKHLNGEFASIPL